MVSIPEYEKGLQERKKLIEKTQKEVESFSPDILQTQMQLRRQTPMIAVGVQETERLRELAKQQALQELQTEMQTQQQLEQEYQAALKSQEDYEYGRRLALKENVFDPSMSEVAREGYRSMREEVKAYEQRKQSIAQFQKDIAEFERTTGDKLILNKSGTKVIGVESRALGMSLELSKYQEIQDKQREEYEQKKQSIAQFLSSVSAPSYTPTIPKPPTVVDIHKPSVREFIGRKLGIQIPSVFEVKEIYKPTEIKKLPEYVLAGEKLLSEQIEKGVTDISRRAGVPTITKQIDIPERRFFERGTGVLQPSGELVLPKYLIIPGAPKAEVEFISPEKIGRIGGLIATAPLYFNPITAGAVLGSQAIESYKQYKAPIPTVENIILEQTKELSSQERKGYLQTEEGEQYKKEVERYVIKELERQKRLSLTIAGVSAGAIIIPSAYMGMKRFVQKAKTPFTISIIAPEQNFFAAEAVSQGELIAGTAKRISISPEWYAQVPTYRTWYAKLGSGRLKVPKSLFTFKPSVYESVQPFVLTGEKGFSFSATKRLGEGKTLKLYDASVEIQKPIELADFSKLPKEFKFISKGLLARDVTDVTSFVGVAETYKGLGGRTKPIISVGKDIIAEYPFRLIRSSKYQKQLFVPTEPMIPVYTKTISRVKPVGSLEADARIYAVESVGKTTKGIRGTAKGGITKDRGIVVIKQIPEPSDVTFISKPDKQRLLSKKQQRQIAARVSQIVPPKKIKPFRTPRTKQVTIPEEYISAPTYVGGLGRGISMYYGKPGKVIDYEDIQPLSLSIRAIPPKEIKAPIKTIFQRPKVFEWEGEIPKERIREINVSAGGTRFKLREEEATAPLFVQRPIEITKQPSRFKLRDVSREKTSLRLRMDLRQARKPRPLFVQFPKRPTPKRPPGVPRRPKKPIKDIGFPLKKKKKIRFGRERIGLVIPYIKRRGEFFAISKPVTLEIAKEKGTSALRRTLAASLQIREVKTGKAVAFAKSTQEFRLGKKGIDPFTLVQRRGKRLGTRQEIAEIIASKKAGRIKFI